MEKSALIISMECGVLLFLTKKQTEFAVTSKDGDVIKATIEETRLDTIEEKQRLRKREYKK